MDARGQDGVEALREAQGDGVAVGDDSYVGWVGLQSLCRACRHVSTGTIGTYTEQERGWMLTFSRRPRKEM